MFVQELIGRHITPYPQAGQWLGRSAYLFDAVSIAEKSQFRPVVPAVAIMLAEFLDVAPEDDFSLLIALAARQRAWSERGPGTGGMERYSLGRAPALVADLLGRRSCIR